MKSKKWIATTGGLLALLLAACSSIQKMPASGATSAPGTEAHALWLGRRVLDINEALREPTRPDAMEKILTLGHDSRYYLMVRGWLRMQLDADMSILQAAGDDARPRVVERIAFVQRAIRLIDLE